MCNNHWWTEYGNFSPWHECPTRPDPGEVLLFYLARRGIGPDEQVAYLSDLLELQKSMVYTILKGESLDTISRCRILVDALKIHPPLLGIDAKYYPIERHAYWWQDCGYSFNADAQGYPLISEVIVYLRSLRTQRDVKGKSKIWTQEDLAEACGLKKETVYRMEHDLNPLITDNMGRRAIVASALGTLARDQEPTISRLFGLDPQAYGVPVSAEDVVLEVHDVPECLTDEILSDYQRTLVSFFDAYNTGHAHHRVAEASAWLRRLEALMPVAETSAQRVQLLALQCRYHLFIAGIACDNDKLHPVCFHTDIAVQLAEQAMALSSPQLGEQGTGAVGTVPCACPVPTMQTQELLAAALLWRADACCELDLCDIGKVDLERVLDLLPTLHSRNVKMRAVTASGLLHARGAKNEMERALALSYFNLAAQLDASNDVRFPPSPLDDHFIPANTGLFRLRFAMALSVPHMRGTTKDSVQDLLQTAQKVTPPELLRQHTLIELFLALDACSTGDYQQAIDFALEALEKSRQIRSRLKRARIEELYVYLLNTNARDQPRLSYLGMKLRTWADRM